MLMAVDTNGNGAAAPHEQEKMNGNNHEEPYRVMVSAKFVVTSLLASMLLAFAVGKAARLVLLEGPRNALLQHSRLTSLRDRPDYHEGYARPLPSLTVKKGKKLPRSRYTSRITDTTMSVSSSTYLNTDRDPDNREGGDARHCHVKEDGEQECSVVEEDEDEEEEEEDDRQPNPSGEHLMVDIKHVSAAFLNSEQRLAQAMVDLVEEADLTLLSYHCHGLTPAGVSCVGVLLQNYVSFHTWPVEGVITFDLCVGGNIPILPVLPAIKRLFGVPRAPSEPGQMMEEPQMRWAHKLRGFRPRPDRYTSLFSATDLGNYVLGDMCSVMKNEVSE